MAGRPSSYVTQNPVTKKWNWYAKCGTNGPGGYDNELGAQVDLRRHQDRHNCAPA